MPPPRSGEQAVMAVTGTSRGIGRGIAEYFAERGFSVEGCSRGESTLAHLPTYRHSTVDVTDESQVRAWVRQVKRGHARVDILVCNVGLVKLGAVTGMMTLETFQSFVNAILTSTFLVCRDFSKVMALQRYGRIINVSSIMTELHAPGTAAYSAAKSGVVALTKVLARELVDTGVTCNVVSPSLVTTESSEVFGAEWKANMLGMQTMRRAIDVTELCNVVSFFAAAESSCITGQVIHTCLVD